MNGAQRRLALACAAGFALILLLVAFANAESMLVDLRSTGVAETRVHVWSWEATSILAWIAVVPAIWRLAARAWLPRFGWRTGLLVLAASVPVSLAHIGLMVAMRKALYALDGERYRFFGAVPERLLYEYRKDLATYCQFLLLAAVVQWLLARAAAPPVPPRPVLAVQDGAVTHQLPIDEIDQVVAAGNYVELHWRGRTLLHRATLAAVATALGADFVRIHRSRLVRRAAIRRIAVEKSGDFVIALADGTEARGSRRYRAGVEAGQPL